MFIYPNVKVELNNLLLTLSSIILLSIAFTYIISCAELALKINLFQYNIVLAYIASNILIYKLRGSSSILVANLIFLILSSSLYYLLSKTYDASWDGQWYHQDAVIKLVEGWNPFYSVSEPNLSISKSDIWIHHYPQASWIVQACILKIGNNIQATKILHLLLSVSCFGISFYAIRIVGKFNVFISALFSLCIAFNPITYSQFFSFYVDGQSAVGLSMYAILLVLLTQNPSKYLYLLLTAVFIYISNIKFTNLVYLSIFNASYFTWYIINNKNTRLKIITYFTALYCFGIFIVGYSSYTRNTIENTHPFYPLLGEKNVGKIVKEIPLSANFVDQNRFENFIDASFAYPVYARQPDSSRFRVPFTDVNYDNFFRTDPEISGFGARWSEILIISCLILIYLLIKLDSKKRFHLLMICSVLLISIFINESCFVARYVPQMWLIPIIFIIYLYSTNRFLAKVVSVVFSLFLIYNTLKIVETQVKYQIEVRNNINLEIDYLKSIQKTIEVKCKYKSVLERLKENNISYVIIQGDNYKERHQFNYTAEENYYIIP